MTILGTFDFANSSLAPENFTRECDILLFADGRISNQGSNGTELVPQEPWASMENIGAW
jgi:hypothetical protein